jgi:hypothetical protein
VLPHQTDNDDRLAARYGLRRSIGRILSGGDFRVSTCGSARAVAIDILTGDSGSTFFAGVETCGSISTCPVCGAKIMRKRAEEITTAIEAHKEAGGSVYMLTLTAPHLIHERCADLLDTVRGSWRKMQAGAPWKRIKAEYGIEHTIRALETKYGRNGWHNHLHLLLFTAEPVEIEALKWRLFERWAKIVKRSSGKECSYQAIDLRQVKTEKEIGEYLNKAALEISELHNKGGKGGGLTPFQLAERAAGGDRKARARFREYAAAFKGARHLTWSRGAKAAFGLAEISDEQAATDKDQCHVAARIERDDYEIVRTFMREAELLTIARDGGQAAVDRFLDRLGLGEETDEIVNRRAAYWGELSRRHHDERPNERRSDNGRKAKAEHRAAEKIGA